MTSRHLPSSARRVRRVAMRWMGALVLGWAAWAVPAGAAVNARVLAEAHQKAVALYSATHKSGEAVALLEGAGVATAVSLAPSALGWTPKKYAEVLNDYGFFLAEDHQPDKALPVLNRVLAQDPERTVAYLNRGDVYRARYDRKANDDDWNRQLADYRIYNDRLVKKKQSFAVPERVERELYHVRVERVPETDKERAAVEKALCQAAEANDLPGVRKYLAAGADPNAGGNVAPTRYRDRERVAYWDEEYAWTPLIHAAKHNNLEMAKWLIQAGAEVHVRSRQRDSVLHLAACYGDLELVKYLIQRGAPYAWVDNSNTQPVASAPGCAESSVEVFDYLIDLKYPESLTPEAVGYLLTASAALFDHEKGEHLTRRTLERFGDLATLAVLSEALTNAVRSGNQRLVDFYQAKGVGIDRDKYIVALLEDAKFAEARAEIEKAPAVGGEVLAKIDMIPLYKTKWQCETKKGGGRYEGTELEELLSLVLGKYDFNAKTKYEYNEYSSRLLNQITGFARTDPNCVDKERARRIIDLLLERGLDPSLFNYRLFILTQLDDVPLTRRLLEGGVRPQPSTFLMVLRYVQSLEMAKLLDEKGIVLKPEEYEDVASTLRKRVYGPVDPETITYYERKTARGR